MRRSLIFWKFKSQLPTTLNLTASIELIIHQSCQYVLFTNRDEKIFYMSINPLVEPNKLNEKELTFLNLQVIINILFTHIIYIHLVIPDVLLLYNNLMTWSMFGESGSVSTASLAHHILSRTY